MGYIAQWGPKGFIVSPEKIVTFDGFSTSIEQSDDSENDTSGKAPTNTKGVKPQNVNLSVTYVRAAGVDPRGQFEEWSGLVGQSYPLYIGGKLFGPEYLKLKKIDLSGLRLSNDGTFLSATIAVSFEEYVKPKATGTGIVKSKTPTTTTTATKQPEPLSDRQKAAYQQKTDRLLAEQEKALQTADAKRKEQLKFATTGMAGGGGGYKSYDGSLLY